MVRRLLRTLRQLPGRRATGGAIGPYRPRPDERPIILSPGRYEMAAAAPKPNYARIERLERELGLVEERPIRPARVCLVKGCDGGDGVRTWSGLLLTRVHDH